MNEPVVHVIDDDGGMRIAVARLLQAEGYEVRTYASAGDFLLKPPEPGPGCVVLDLQMPGPSGLELQEALQRRPHALPIVFLTGRGDIASSVRAMKSGAVDFIAWLDPLNRPNNDEKANQSACDNPARDHIWRVTRFRTALRKINHETESESVKGTGGNRGPPSGSCGQGKSCKKRNQDARLSM